MKKYIVFSASWCGPCQQYKPILSEAQSQIPIQIVDVDQNKELAAQYNVRSVPTTILLQNGIEVKRLMGVQNKQSLIQNYG